jgi:polynucleotide 5'-kinase involved in rRNA processing
VSTQVDNKKSIFNLNKSWKESLSSIVKAVSENKAEVMLINGVVNSGKSTFATCLINQLLSRT